MSSQLIVYKINVKMKTRKKTLKLYTINWCEFEHSLQTQPMLLANQLLGEFSNIDSGQIASTWKLQYQN